MRAFCEFYAQGASIAKAAEDAGYSRNYALHRASALLKRPEIMAEIRRLRERINQLVEKSAADVVNEYSVIAFTDRIDFLKEDPDYPGQLCFKSPRELTEEQRKCVEKVHVHKRFSEPDEDGNVHFIREEYSYTLMSKESALNQMGRHFGIFDDKIGVGVQQNPFKNLSTEQLLKLKNSFTTVLAKGAAVEGQLIESKPRK